MVKNKFNLMAVISDLRAGGAEKVIIELLLRLKNAFNVSVACIRDKGELSRVLENESIRIYHTFFKGRIHPQSIFALASLLRRENIHIVHTHMYRPNISGAISAFVARVPVIISHIHSVHQWDSKRQILMDRLTLWIKDGIITVSEEVKRNYLEKVSKARPDKLRVIYNGVDPQFFKKLDSSDELMSSLKIKKGSPVIGIAARLAPEKDHMTFLEAASIVSRVCPQARFLIVGKGPEEMNIRAQIESRNLQDKVMLLGYRRDIPEILNLLDIFVLPSIREGFSLAILEAMAVGKPVIATDVGGNREAVVNGVTGFIVPKRDPSSLALQILTLIRNPEIAAEMGEKGRKRVLERFTIEATVAEITKFYLELLEKKGISVNRTKIPIIPNTTK